ncbi:MAG TPA: SET domain-containing protein-lysine N-methyltransferase [Patescibacteria group bacterium]|nr:SET domain-containing protein-lysine N-methyltransferase [Patescibacteria group bacterium]
MNKILPPKKIYVGPSDIAKLERGVFAANSIKKGELIEMCPIIELSEYDTMGITDNILITYSYYFGKKKEKSLIALGFGSIYNHTRTPNATYKIKAEESVIEFIAIKDIKRDEEITVNYNYANPNDKTPMWFE